MIRRLPLLFPASLLDDRGITPRTETLLRECAQMTPQCRWRDIKGLMQETQDLLEDDELIDCAVLCLHLGDRCLATGRLGTARENYERAREIFSRHQFRPEQRHNAAVATYALGLMDLFLGEEEAALTLYGRAKDLFARSQDHWRSTGNAELDRRCAKAVELIAGLEGIVMQVLLEGGTTALPYLLRQREAMERENDAPPPPEVDEDAEAEDEEVFGVFVRDHRGRVWFFTRRPRIFPDDA